VSQDKYLAPDKGLLESTVLERIPEPTAEEALQSRERAISHLRLLWINRAFIVRVLCWSAIVSTLLVLLIPSRYQALTRLMPPDNQSATSMAMVSALTGRGGIGGLGGLAGDLMGLKSSGALFVGILESRTVQDRLIQEFDLQRVYRDAKIEDARKDLTRHTEISEDRKSGIILIGVTDHEPKRAAAMASAYVRELDRLVAEVSTSAARRERIFLEDRLRSVKQDLDTAAGKFSEFASKNTAIDIPAQGKAMLEAAAKLQGELIVAESELRGLEAIYTEQNSRVRALRARVAELQSQLGKLGGNVGSSSTGEQGSNYPSIRQLPLLGVTYADLYRQTKIEETVFELLTQQYELAKVQEAKEIPSVKVLDVAVVPTKKVFPPRTLLVLASVCACVFLACAWLFAKAGWKRIAPQDPEKQFVREVVRGLESDTARLLSQTSFLRRLILPNGTGGATPKVDSDKVNNNAAETPEAARAARNSTS
jgi:capsule polysaccharide export protein KpsE/RkpR